MEAASYAEGPDGRWSALLESGSLSNVYAQVRRARGAVRRTGEELRQELGIGESEEEALPGWLVAPLTALDGRELGWIQLLDKPDAGFTELDEAVLVHLAQMAAAALERARLYMPR